MSFRSHMPVVGAKHLPPCRILIGWLSTWIMNGCVPVSSVKGAVGDPQQLSSSLHVDFLVLDGLEFTQSFWCKLTTSCEVITLLGTVECWLILQLRWVTTFSALTFWVWRIFPLTHKLRQSANITYHGLSETQHTRRVDCEVFHDISNNVTAVAVPIFEHTLAVLWAKKNVLKTRILKLFSFCAGKEWVSPTSHAWQRTPPSTVASSQTPGSRSSWWFPKRRPGHHGEGSPWCPAYLFRG